MKKFSVILFLLIAAGVSNAQEISFRSNRMKLSDKTKLFNLESARFKSKVSMMSEVMSYQLNQEVRLQISSKTSFKGKVTAITNDAPGLTTVIMKSSEIAGLVFSVSRLEHEGNVTYRGVMLSKGHSDMMLLEQDEINNDYVWNKKEVSHMIAD
ncbi:MAG: hypothetical protein KGP35_01635 [Bacteroidetes bacterium]|nr:hypothetical protein [Bacteroidota bacterium]